MRYMMLIYSEERDWSQVSQEEADKVMVAYNAFGQEAQARGVLESGDALQPSQTATTVRVREGKTLTTDGPFAETKEVLGGFYILNCKDLDEAIEFAAKIPGAAIGSVEIRPIMEFN
jgi:hypothetical protein